jgi:hypothetical protein
VQKKPTAPLAHEGPSVSSLNNDLHKKFTKERTSFLKKLVICSLESRTACSDNQLLDVLIEFWGSDPVHGDKVAYSRWPHGPPQQQKAREELQLQGGRSPVGPQQEGARARPVSPFSPTTCPRAPLAGSPTIMILTAPPPRSVRGRDYYCMTKTAPPRTRHARDSIVSRTGTRLGGGASSSSFGRRCQGLSAPSRSCDFSGSYNDGGYANRYGSGSGYSLYKRCRPHHPLNHQCRLFYFLCR